jgi:OOP family OmpA-OmpF porin
MAELPPINNPPPIRSAVSPSGPVGETLPAQASAIAPPPAASSRWRGVRGLLTWTGRWLLLGSAVSGAWLLGVGIAQVFPAKNPSPPLQEVVLRRTNRTLHKFRQLPSWWAGNGLRPSASTGTPPLISTPRTPTLGTPPVTLSEAQQAQITVELDAVREDLQRLRDRTSALEAQLSLPTVEAPVEQRLANLENRLSPPTAVATPEATPDVPAEAPAPARSPQAPVDPLFQAEAYRVTLPSDILFTPGSAILQPNAEQLLNSILLDVGRYPGATIMVGSYTDAAAAPDQLTDLSFKQASTIQRYLADRLNNQDYHWVAVGYGDSAIGAVEGTQLSRRIAIAIVPR